MDGKKNQILPNFLKSSHFFWKATTLPLNYVFFRYTESPKDQCAVATFFRLVVPSCCIYLVSCRRGVLSKMYSVNMQHNLQENTHAEVLFQ